MKLFPLALAALLLSACTTTASKPPPTPQELAEERGYQLGAEVKEVKNYEIDGWRHVSNRALIIPARPSRHYLLMLNRPCPDLQTTEVIGFTTTVNSVLSRFDAVVVVDGPGGMEQKCYIERMYSITKTKK